MFLIVVVLLYMVLLRFYEFDFGGKVRYQNVCSMQIPLSLKLLDDLPRRIVHIKMFFCFKGGESSSQFRWFTRAKIELLIFDIFCFDFGAAFAKVSNKYKKMSPRKKFLETLSFDLPAKTTVL